MGLFGISFNIVNIVISALIFGLGDDYSLYIMDGLLQQYKTGKKVLSSYKTSIFLSAITTVTGLGALIFAKHPALRSIALISIIGICSVVIMSQILIPFFFNLLIRNRTKKQQFPWTLGGFLKSIFAFCYFVSGCILLTLLGFLFRLFANEKSKYVYHWMLSKFTWSMMYIMGNVKKRVINPQYANFAEPAVIISNHQSFLDILSLVMLHPKLILLTNNWVWNSPVFGAVARMADFYPVANGAEQSVKLLGDRVKHGYSIVVFPEGTRSVDGAMKRFHKGAFYLAEQLNIDILPIVLHGTGYTMTKGDFLLKDGTITIEYLPRIKPNDKAFGEGFAERTKRISRYFKDQFKRLSTAIEQPAYFKEQLIYNYLYKGPTIEWELRRTLQREQNYSLFHAALPVKGKILEVGCGYGFMTYMLHFAAKEREFTALDGDEEKIETAANCFSKNDKVKFVWGNTGDVALETYDGIILNDTSAEEKKVLVEKCIRHLVPGGTLIIKNAETNQLANDITATGNLKFTEVDQKAYSAHRIFITEREELE
jgi:1-acyl-sn-glycerol-3-phosphate acyltransferase